MLIDVSRETKEYDRESRGTHNQECAGEGQQQFTRKTDPCRAGVQSDQIQAVIVPKTVHINTDRPYSLRS
jgi:hypothetical protein